MWVLDRGNSHELIAALEPHARSGALDSVAVGEGWRDLVAECHARLIEVDPVYRFSAIKQKWAELACQVDTSSSPRDTTRRIGAITDEFQARSAVICEWCGRDGEYRERLVMDLTLCGDCDRLHADPPYPVYGCG
ncbi:hypothetical protein [Jiangella alba]|uniref:Uncharacterized protein n=1 Tax=Jiangella alba TaxID=561176 RepID=A0A1H5MQ97_9ACTN|nr:hypothetical protein [Jiangella alba]SEE91393.1 hypothetical protein SAMN04488561_3333 [Jiangella alba]